jgi:hypothetical protein
MFSDNTQKQILLLSGIIVALGGVLSAVAGIVGNFTDFFGKIDALHKLPGWAFWITSCALFLLCLWLLIKWRTRHSVLLKPDALRLERDNAEHLVGRADDINNLLQKCVANQIVFLEGESGSGKSALVRAGLLPRFKDVKSVLPLMLGELWVDSWERGPFQALKNAMIDSGAFAPDAAAKSAEDQPNSAARPLSTLVDVEGELARLSDENSRTALIIFDQFDDYQARNHVRFLPNKTWLDPATLQRDNPFWNMVGHLLEGNKVHLLFVARSDTAAGLTSVQFLGPVQAMRLNRVPSANIAELLTRLTEVKAGAPVIADPEAGWNALKARIVQDISQQDVVLPQQLKVMLGGVQSLKRLNISQYERADGAAGIEALYVERQISGTARVVGMDTGQVRSMLVNLIDPLSPTKTRSCSKEDLAAAVAKAGGPVVTRDRLDKALEELERGEMVRSAGNPESTLTAYRLDHDYLTRGVLAAERRANRWYYLLEDGANALESASSLAARWKALLPISTQFRLAWERLRGMVRYGRQQNYALASLARFAPVLLMLALIGFGWWQVDRWREGQAAGEIARQIWLKFEFRRGVRERELEGAWTLAGATDVRMRQEFVGQLLNTPEYAEHLIIQPDLVVQALLGVNPDTRDSMMAILDASLNSEPYTTTTAAAAAIALRSGKIESIKPGPIVEAIKNTKDDDERTVLMQALGAVARQLKPENAYALARPIVEAVRSTTNVTLMDVLALLAPQLKPEDAYALARPVVEALKGSTNVNLRPAFTALVPQLKSEDLHALALSIVEAIKGTTSLNQLRALGDVLAAGAPKLKPEDAYSLARLSAEAISETKNADQLRALTQALTAVARQLKPEDAYALARPIVEAIKGTTNVSSMEAIAAVAPRLKPEDAYALARPIVESIKGTTNFSQLKALTQPLAAVVRQMTPEDARAIAGPIVGAIKDMTDADQRVALAQDFSSVAPRLKPEDAYLIAGPIVEAVKGTKDLSELNPFVASALASVAPQLRPEDRRPLAQLMVEAINQDRQAAGPPLFASDTLVAIAPQLNPEDAYALASQITETITTTTQGTARTTQATAASGIILFGFGFDRRAFSQTKALAALMPRLKPEDAYALARPIVEAIKGTKDNFRLRVLTQAFPVLMPRLKPEDAYALARPIIEAIKDAKDSDQFGALAQSLAALVPQLKPEDARTIAGPIVETMTSAKDPDQLGALAPTFVAIAPQVKLEDARAFTGVMMEAAGQVVVPSKTVEAIAALARQLPWPERLKLFVSALKYPTIYDKSRDVLITAIKEHPAAKTIASSGDIWAVIEWLKTQPGIDLTAPPQRTKTATR